MAVFNEGGGAAPGFALAAGVRPNNAPGAGYTAPAPSDSPAVGTQAPGTYFAPPSGSPLAAEQYAAAQAAYKNALVRFNSQRTGLLKQYGYAGDINPGTGLVGNIRVDAGNPYGGLQSMLHNQAVEDQGAQFAAQDRHLVGGLAHQAEGELHYQHGAQTTGLAQALLGSLGDINTQQQGAQGTLDQALWQMQQQAAQDAIAQGDFNPADVGSDVTDSYPSSPGGGTPNARAAIVARNVGSASQSALNAAKRRGASPAAAALAARSAGMDAKYGLKSAPKPAAKPAANAYTSGRKKRG